MRMYSIGCENLLNRNTAIKPTLCDLHFLQVVCLLCEYTRPPECSFQLYITLEDDISHKVTFNLHNNIIPFRDTDEDGVPSYKCRKFAALNAKETERRLRGVWLTVKRDL